MKYRRKIMLICIVLTAALLISFSYYLWCIGGAVGYIAGKMTGGKDTGVSGRVKSIILPVRKYQLHLHHWLLASIILIACVVTDSYIIAPQLFYGSMAGLAFQGIFCYDDWFRLIKKNIRRSSEQVKLAVAETNAILQQDMPELSKTFSDIDFSRNQSL